MFEIDPDTGVLQSRLTLDREAVAQYVVTIEASDHGTPNRLSSQIELVIDVTDVNDNAPVFEENVYSVNLGEGSSINSVVIWIQATDQDIGRNAEISYTLTGQNRANQYFALDRNTGLCVSCLFIYG